MIRRAVLIPCLVSMMCLVTPCLAAEESIDPGETQAILTMLLSAANEPIASCPTCNGDYGQPGKARLRDLLSSRLAYLYNGENKILGRTEGSGASKTYVITLTHAAGEDVASAEIRFRTKHGKVDMKTLQCVLTP